MLEAVTKSSCDGVRVVMIAGNLAVVADGYQYPRGRLDANVSLYNKAIVSQVRSVEGRGRII